MPQSFCICLSETFLQFIYETKIRLKLKYITLILQNKTQIESRRLKFGTIFCEDLIMKFYVFLRPLFLFRYQGEQMSVNR